MEPQQYIHSLGRFSGAPGLHRIRALCGALGDPQKRLKFVHIAGTNGKGSTAAMTAGILQCAGYRTGLFTSPYLTVFNERIRVDGQMIPDADLARLTARVARAAEGLTLPAGEHIGEFEFVTAVGMLYFLERQCDLVVLETGLGGTFDASNVIDAPLVAVITPISLDHTAVLGDTVEEIARTKAGIIKPGTAVVCAPEQPVGALREIGAACYRQGVSLHMPGGAEILSAGLDGTDFRYYGREYHLALVGRHQVQNALAVLHSLIGLRGAGFAIDDDAIRRGLAQVRFPGRLERVGARPDVLLDGAHNPGGVDALCRAVDEFLAGRRLFVVLGMVADKAAKPCVHEIARRAAAVFAVAPDSERALPSAELAALAALDCAAVHDCGTAAAAIPAALQAAAPDDCVLVCGSLYLVGEAEKIFAARQKTAE